MLVALLQTYSELFTRDLRHHLDDTRGDNLDLKAQRISERVHIEIIKETLNYLNDVYNTNFQIDFLDPQWIISVIHFCQHIPHATLTKADIHAALTVLNQNTDQARLLHNSVKDRASSNSSLVLLAPKGRTMKHKGNKQLCAEYRRSARTAREFILDPLVNSGYVNAADMKQLSKLTSEITIKLGLSIFNVNQLKVALVDDLLSKGLITYHQEKLFTFHISKRCALVMSWISYQFKTLSFNNISICNMQEAENFLLVSLFIDSLIQYDSSDARYAGLGLSESLIMHASFDQSVMEIWAKKIECIYFGPNKPIHVFVTLLRTILSPPVALDMNIIILFIDKKSLSKLTSQITFGNRSSLEVIEKIYKSMHDVNQSCTPRIDWHEIIDNAINNKYTINSTQSPEHSTTAGAGAAIGDVSADIRATIYKSMHDVTQSGTPRADSHEIIDNAINNEYTINSTQSPEHSTTAGAGAAIGDVSADIRATDEANRSPQRQHIYINDCNIAHRYIGSFTDNAYNSSPNSLTSRSTVLTYIPSLNIGDSNLYIDNEDINPSNHSYASIGDSNLYIDNEDINPSNHSYASIGDSNLDIDNRTSFTSCCIGRHATAKPAKKTTSNAPRYSMISPPMSSEAPARYLVNDSMASRANAGYLANDSADI